MREMVVSKCGEEQMLVARSCAVARKSEMSGISWLIFLEFHGPISSDLQILRHFP